MGQIDSGDDTFFLVMMIKMIRGDKGKIGNKEKPEEEREREREKVYYIH